MMSDPSPEFKAEVAAALAPFENLIESLWEELDALTAEWESRDRD